MRIDVPDYETFIDFPDNTPPEVITTTLAKNFPSKKIQDEPSFWKDVVVKTGKDIAESAKPLLELGSWYGAPGRVIRKGLKGESVLGAIGEEITKPVANVLGIIQPAANIAYTPAVITQEGIKNIVRGAKGQEPVSPTGLGDVGRFFKGEERTGMVEEVRGKKFESPFVQGLVEGTESLIDPLLGFPAIAQTIAKNIPKGFIGKIPKEMLRDLKYADANEVVDGLANFDIASKR